MPSHRHSIPWYIALEKIWIKSWWIVLFMLGCYFVFEQAMVWHREKFETLHNQHSALLKEKARAKNQMEALRLKVNSQSDQEYVELVLMQRLGLVPEGATKVLFTDKP